MRTKRGKASESELKEILSRMDRGELERGLRLFKRELAERDKQRFSPIQAWGHLVTRND